MQNKHVVHRDDKDTREVGSDTRGVGSSMCPKLPQRTMFYANED